jgi:hypothetical protein
LRIIFRYWQLCGWLFSCSARFCYSLLDGFGPDRHKGLFLTFDNEPGPVSIFSRSDTGGDSQRWIRRGLSRYGLNLVIMRKVGSVNLAVALGLLLLAVILFLLSGFGPGALDSEKRFIAGLLNSLYYIDEAKRQWANEKHKSELDTPVLPDLMPYLGKWTNTIQKFTALGITYRITSMAEPQTDVATLTRGLCFRKGFCHFYPAGTSYCLQTGWTYPQSSTTSSVRAFFMNNRYFFTVALCVLAMGNVVVFVIKNIEIRNRRRHEEYE